jgi:hypothetical protein
LDEWFPISIHPPHSDGQADLNTWFGSAAHKIKSSSKGSAAKIKLLRRRARPFKIEIENLLAPAHPFDWRAGMALELSDVTANKPIFQARFLSTGAMKQSTKMGLTGKEVSQDRIPQSGTLI